MDPSVLEPQNEHRELRILLCLTSEDFLNSLDLVLKTKQNKKGTRWDSLMTWKHLEGAENRQICPADSLCLCHFGTAAGDGCQHRRALTRTHPAWVIGPKGNADIEDKPDTLSYCIHKEQQM